MKRFLERVTRPVWRFLNANGPLHAAALTYFALLALVPILCCVLVAAKYCGVDRLAREQLDERIDALIENVEKGQDDVLASLPLMSSESEVARKRIAAAEFGKTARTVSDELFSRIDGFDVGTLGWIGFVFLLWTVISSLASVETSFNVIFDVPVSRPIWKRAYLYLFVLVLLPVLGVVVMSLPFLNAVKNVIVVTLGSSYLTRWASEGLVWFLDSWLLRYVLTLSSATLSLGYFFWLLPNCHVRIRSALIGGLITAFLLGCWVRVCAVAQVGLVKASALYGSFAFLPIVLAWLYMSWQIVLFGACCVRELNLPPARTE